MEAANARTMEREAWFGKCACCGRAAWATPLANQGLTPPGGLHLWKIDSATPQIAPRGSIKNWIGQARGDVQGWRAARPSGGSALRACAMGIQQPCPSRVVGATSV